MGWINFFKTKQKKYDMKKKTCYQKNYDLIIYTDLHVLSILKDISKIFAKIFARRLLMIMKNVNTHLKRF